MTEYDDCLKKTLAFNFEKDCITYLISKLFSIGLIILSFLNKLPQIFNMYKSKQIKGLSYMSIYLDVICTLCASLYPFHMGYPFLTYGEIVFILIENFIIFILTWKYETNASNKRNNLSFIFLIFGFIFICTKGNLNEKTWKIIGSTSTSFGILSKLIQIIKSYKEKSTGPLSTFTFSTLLFGNVLRFYTSFVETKDYFLAVGCFIAFILNSTIFLQIIYYNRNKKNKDGNNKKII